MKTITTILAVIFTLQVGVLFAGNENITTHTTEITSSFNILSLAPSSPVEATFEDIVVENVFLELSLVTPMVASFEDFSDPIDPVTIDLGQLSPVTPLAADFE